MWSRCWLRRSPTSTSASVGGQEEVNAQSGRVTSHVQGTSQTREACKLQSRVKEEASGATEVAPPVGQELPAESSELEGRLSGVECNPSLVYVMLC